MRIPSFIFGAFVLATSTGFVIAGTGTSGSRMKFQTEPPGAVLTNVSMCLGHIANTSRSPCPVCLNAVVTWDDPGLPFMVVQDDTGAMSVQLPRGMGRPLPGDYVNLTGMDVKAGSAACPVYPDQPTTNQLLNSFEEGPGLGTWYLDRLSGWLRPPSTGLYTFWIASDDSGLLFLSPDASPDHAQLIASNVVGNATLPQEWDRFPSQRSMPVKLQAGDFYYIKTLHFQSYGSDNLSVAWSGPGMDRSVIEGRYLVPWNPQKWDQTPNHFDTSFPAGLLREEWKPFLQRDFSALLPASGQQALTRIESLAIQNRGPTNLPDPKFIGNDSNPDSLPNTIWVRIRGQVDFAAGGQGIGQLQLSRGKSSISAKMFRWEGAPIEGLLHQWVEMRGMLVHTFTPSGEVSGSILWVPGTENITLVTEEGSPESGDDEDRVAISDIQAGNPEMWWGRHVRISGRCTGIVSNGLEEVQGGDLCQGFCSPDGVHWTPIGGPVELDMNEPTLSGIAITTQATTNQNMANFGFSQGWSGLWHGADIGNPDHHGQFLIRGTNIILKGDGKLGGLDSDHLFMAYQPTSDPWVDLVANLNGISPGTQAGIMVRQSLNRKASFAAVYFNASSGVSFQYRPALGNALVNVRPSLRYRQFQWLKLVNQKNVIQVRLPSGVVVRAGEKVEVSGIINWKENLPILVGSVSEIAPDGGRVSSAKKPVETQGLTMASFCALAQHPPKNYGSHVLSIDHMSGVVTFSGLFEGRRILCAQDGSGLGVEAFWRDPAVRPDFQVGQEVSLSGQALTRRFPVLFETLGIEATGWGNLPEPAQFSLALLNGDDAQARWVEVSGVVRSEQPPNQFQMMTDEGMLSIWEQPGSGEWAKPLGDALVKVRGVLVFDAQHRFTLLVPGPDFIEVLQPAAPDPFAIPRFAIGQLAGLNMRPDKLRHMKVAGVVTCVLPDGAYVQDDSGGAFLEMDNPAGLRPGDQIEAVGFPSPVSGLVRMDLTLVRKTGSGSMPKPENWPKSEILQQKVAGQLVNLKATLLDQYDSLNGQVLVLRRGAKIFEASLVDSGGRRLPRIPEGSLLAVSGICQWGPDPMQSSDYSASNPQLSSALKIWLPDSMHVQVIQSPPWLTRRRVAGISLLFGLGLLGSLLWVRRLRRRVEERTRELAAAMNQLAQETRTAAVLAERDRLAGEIHDSLEQGLTAIMLQLDMAANHLQSPGNARDILLGARNMAEFTRAEVQHAVWDIQSPLLDNADFATALKHVAGQVNSSYAEVRMKMLGKTPDLDSSQAHHLLRIAQEAITNASKHAQARVIQVTLDCTGEDLNLIIQDDGLGFEPENDVNQPTGRHFGLKGMRARTKRLKATLKIDSQPGHGTVISVRMGIHRTPSQNSTRQNASQE